ncbi:MAG: sugar ABC transporter substrate-binding protein [Lachnospiraceae bacterium]|nr:sugar ABC transporter substrate-binding protein [Lachnospiraceae bacterium]
MKRKKILSLILVLMLTLTALAGCGDGQQGDKNTEGANQQTGGSDVGGDETKAPVEGDGKIVFMGWTNATEKRAYQKAIEQFEELYDCEVEYVPVGVNEYKTKLTSMLSADAMSGECSADVFYIPYGMTWNLAVSGHIENLQPYVDADEAFNMEDYWFDAGYAQYMFNMKDDIVGEGDLYAFPKDVGPWGLVYNKTLFAQYGIEAPTWENPWTWDDLIALADKVDNRNGDLSVKRDTWLLGGADIEQVVYSYGASYLSEDRKSIAIDTPEFKAAIQKIVDMIKASVTPNSDEVSALDPYTRWVNGKIGIYYGGPWDIVTYTDYLNFEWDYLPLIAGPNGKQMTTWGYMGLGVSSRSTDKELAYEFAKFLSTNEDCQRQLYKMGQIVPNIISMAKGEFVEFYANAQPGVEAWIKILEEHGHSEEQFLTPSNSWYDPFTSLIGKVFEGSMTVDDFVAQVQPEMQKELDIGWNELAELKKQVNLE